MTRAAAGTRHAEEAEQRALLRVLGDVGALALPAVDQAVGRERVERLAHRALAHVQAAGERLLRRQRLAGGPLAGGNLLHEEVVDLLVEGTVARRLVHGGTPGRGS